MALRSQEWFSGSDESSVRHRSALASLGFDPRHIKGKPIVGICYPRSEFNNCEIAFDSIVPVIKRGVIAAGGIPLVFPTMSLSGELLKPADMLYRNLVSMDVEETLRGYPIDGVVLLCNCDKTTPAQLMAAASANIPAIQFNAGPKFIGSFEGQSLSSGTDFWNVLDRYRAGDISEEQWQRLEFCLSCSTGACNEMGTTSTMTALSEALGMMPPGTSSIPAHDTRRLIAAEAIGRYIVDLVCEQCCPSTILTLKAFKNAIRVLNAIGGSTNAVIHLIAIAGRRRIQLPVELFNDLATTTPVLANIKPCGQYLMTHFHEAGGVPALMKQMLNLLDLDCPTITGQTIGENVAAARCVNSNIIRSPDTALNSGGALAILKGNIVSRGALIKVSAATKSLLQHTGPAVVFNSYEDMLARIDLDDLQVTSESVLIMRNVGPIAVPGMPEWGQIPIPRKLLRKGVKDIVRISDARMSGTSFGTVVLHATPEAAIGGPLAIVQDGDLIELDVPSRKLEMLVKEDEISRRLLQWSRPSTPYVRGYPRLYIDHVLQADEGCDFDFLRPDTDDALPFIAPLVRRS